MWLAFYHFEFTAAVAAAAAAVVVVVFIIIPSQQRNATKPHRQASYHVRAMSSPAGLRKGPFVFRVLTRRQRRSLV